MRAELVQHHAGWFSGLDPWLSTYGLPCVPPLMPVPWTAHPAHLGAAEVFSATRGLDRRAVHAHATGLADALRARLGMPPAGSAIVAGTP
jgi:hypothetical protein